MKKVLLLAAVIIIAWMVRLLPFSGTDIGKLHPVEAVLITNRDGVVYVETDTGIFGSGENMALALSNLILSASGSVFLETANYVLIDWRYPELLQEIGNYFRPACQLYYYTGVGKLNNIGKYLETHPSTASILTHRQGGSEISHIVIEGEEYRIEG
ncbi:MAG: hypothetical protein E7453_07705 [Ruminococcaceae bacterium]|nr:hypothetical protein [Oscillospiraceae bacterium]